MSVDDGEDGEDMMASVNFVAAETAENSLEFDELCCERLYSSAPT
jgi:hypothetical protein